MRKRKYDPDVYAALRAAGMNNQTIARKLDVNEASVRRGLKDAPPVTPVLAALVEELSRLVRPTV